MKNLILLRHAKSEVPVPGKSDFERHLKKRGIDDIKRVAEMFCKTNTKIDIVLCSTSVRTRETLRYFTQVCTVSEEVQYLDKLYHASADDMLDCIREAEENHNSLLVVGHNMGISYLAAGLANVSIPELPTSGLVHFVFKNQIGAGLGQVKQILFPKEI